MPNPPKLTPAKVAAARELYFLSRRYWKGEDVDIPDSILPVIEQYDRPIRLKEIAAELGVSVTGLHAAIHGDNRYDGKIVRTSRLQRDYAVGLYLNGLAEREIKALTGVQRNSLTSALSYRGLRRDRVAKTWKARTPPPGA